MKKRITAMTIILAMCVTLFAGCSDASSDVYATEGSDTDSASVDTTGSEDSSTDSTASEEVDYSGSQLVVCTWGGSTGEATKELAADFEEEYGVEVVIDEVNANSDRIAKLQSQVNSGAVEDDVVYLSGSYANQAEKLGLFEPIDTDVVTSTDELFDFAKNDSGYGPMVCIDRYGIMYNEDLLEEKGLEAPTSYMDLFDDKYAGLVSLPAMTSTAGPYVLAAIAEDLGGSLEDYQAALDLYEEKKDNIKLWYTTDLVPALSQQEVGITVYMDLMIPILQSSGLNMKWVDAEEGNFADDVYINVVKDAPNKELAQLFIQYALQKSTQEEFIDLNNESPTNQNAEMSEDKQEFLAYGQEDFDECTFFDYDLLNEIQPTLVEEWQKIVAQ